MRVVKIEAGAKVSSALLAAEFAESLRAAKRLISQGAVRTGGMAVRDPEASCPDGVLSVGSRRFVLVVRPG